MSSVTRPRGPLPARVYWTRRLVLLVLVLGLVFGVAHLIGGGGGSGSPSAQPVDAPVGTSTTHPTSTPHATPTEHARPKKTKSKKHRGAKQAKATKTATPLAVPTGPCRPRDVRVDPKVVGTAHAGTPVTFRLRLTTLESPACNWTVSPGSLVVKLTSGSDRIWSTQDCKGAIHKQQVVVRKDHRTKVQVTWHGQRSDGACSRTTAWAQPGYYHVAAAALGAEPTDVQFKLHKPATVTITPSPTVKPAKKHRHSDGSPSAHPSAAKTD